MNPYRYAGLDETELESVFMGIIRRSDMLCRVLDHAQTLALPNWRVVSGALYNTVWNHLTGRPEGYGIKDVDLFYFDKDTSWEAENTVIETVIGFPPEPPVEIRNQARVHLWFEAHFGHKIEPLTSVEHGIDRFASTTHCVGLCTSDLGYDLYAPYGLTRIFAMQVWPNPVQPNRETHEAKAARQKALWPELEIIPWPKK